MLVIQKGKIEYPEKLLFEHERLVVSTNKIVAIVGANGTGKTTFLNRIVESLQNGNHQVEFDGSYVMVHQISETTDPLSGGEKVKKALNKAFARKPNLLLLDEPSANLDETTQRWLSKRLKEYHGIVLLVSHDIDLLNLANETWLIKDKKLEVFPGNYAFTEDILNNRENKQERAYNQQQREIHRLEQQIIKREQRAYRIKKGNGKKLSNSDKKALSRTSHDQMEKKMQRSAKALERRLERMPKIEKVAKSQVVRFIDPNEAKYLRSTVLIVKNQTIKFGKKILIEDVNFKLKYGQKLWLRGNNGSGKTTLVKTILNNREKYIAPNVGVGYFSQELQDIDLKETMWNNAAKDSLQNKQVIYTVLGGLDLKQIHQKASELSGGQLVRLQLAKVLLGNNQFLILDEPTNYLDLETKKSLQQFLQNYPGTILLISHNRQFAKTVTDNDLMITNKKLLTREQRQQYNSADQGNILKLQMKLDQLISDPTVSLEEIKQVQMKIRMSQK